MENYLRSYKNACVTIQLWDEFLGGVDELGGGVPLFLENEMVFLQGLTHPETQVVMLSGDLVSRILEMGTEPTREMRLPFPLIYLDSAIPIIGRGPSRHKTNLTYHGLLLFEVPQSYLNDEGDILLPFMRCADPEAYAGLDDAYGRGDIRIMGYNSEGETLPSLTRLWLHQNTPPGGFDVPVDDYEAAQLRRFVAGFLTLLERGEAP